MHGKYEQNKKMQYKRIIAILLGVICKIDLECDNVHVYKYTPSFFILFYYLYNLFNS